MKLLNEVISRAKMRQIDISVNDYIFGIPSIAQKCDGEKGGTISRLYFEVYAIPKSIVHSLAFREIVHTTTTHNTKGYFTKETAKIIMSDYERYFVGRFSYDLLESIETTIDNNGKRFELFVCALFNGIKTDRDTDVLQKIDVLTVQKRAAKQAKFCGFSRKGRLNKKQSYSSMNIDLD